jgi:hypothetical protein
MTISPPSNVKVEEIGPGKVLASGFDTLVLAMDVEWQQSDFFDLLERLKQQAKRDERQAPDVLTQSDQSEHWVFNVLPNGSKGYEWLLVAQEFTLKIGNWMNPKSRPSVMAEIRSEALWHRGPADMAQRISSLLTVAGGVVGVIKASRADPCIDLLLPKDEWTVGLLDHAVTRAIYSSPHFWNRRLTGISIGKGNLGARLYDKPLEIVTKSHKEWMYDVWSIRAVPENFHIIRVEFQLRREALKDLGINTLTDLLKLAGNLWSYCTRDWLKFQDDASKHHTQQETLPWWKVVQDGFTGAQGACPLVRAKAVQVDELQLLRQLLGQLTSLAALYRPGVLETGELIEVRSLMELLKRTVKKTKLEDSEITERVREKLAKYQRKSEKFKRATSAREAMEVISQIETTNTAPELGNTP